MTSEVLYVTDIDLHRYTKSLFFPVILLLNFTFFQYLVLLFYARCREKHVLLLLLFTSCVSVVALVPYATQSEVTIASLNDVSESCLALMLLVQTALVGTKHVKGPSANVSRPLQYFADLLILFDCGVVVLGIICVFRPHTATEFGGTNVINNVSENLTLAFTFLFRFIGLGKDKGWRQMVRDDRWELVFHVVFMMHEYPFMPLENETHISWEYVQAIFMQLALTPCMWMTVGEHHHHRQIRHQQKTISMLELRRLSANSLKQLIQTATTVVDEKDAMRSKSVAIVYAVKEDNNAELEHTDLQATAEAVIDNQPPLNGASEPSKD